MKRPFSWAVVLVSTRMNDSSPLAEGEESGDGRNHTIQDFSSLGSSK